VTLVAQNATPSTLADVIGQVVGAFAHMGDATPIMVGEHYLERAVGAPPRVVFVPERAGTWGPAQELGYAASITHACEVHVRASADGDDVERLRALNELSALVISCVRTAAPGRIAEGKYEVSSIGDADAFGLEAVIAFTYRQDIPHSVARWSLPAATADVSSKRVGVPPGEPGQVTTVVPTTVPKEP
jgi:hypothetical protein